MNKKQRSIKVFSVSRSGRVLPQKPISHRRKHKLSSRDSSQLIKSPSVLSNNKSNSQAFVDFEPAEHFHQNPVKEQRTKFRKPYSLAKIIGCFLVTLLVAGGLTGLITGLIFTNQKNTSTTSAETTTVITTTSVTTTTVIPTTTVATTTVIPTTTVATTTVITTTTVATTTVIPTTTVATTTVIPTTTTTRINFALNQNIIGYPVTCSSVDNTNAAYTQCNDFQRTSLYGAGLATCSTGWSTTSSAYWPIISLCKALLNSATATFEAYYVCGTSDTRFTYLNSTWDTINETRYTKDMRCYY